LPFLYQFKAFYTNCYIEGEEYVLLYESGCQAQFMPGTTYFFCLKKYHEETGTNYKRIVLYLCTQGDLQASEKGGYTSSVNESDDKGFTGDGNDVDRDSNEPAAKRAHVNDDEMLAI
jgi:hypothetical protein